MNTPTNRIQPYVSAGKRPLAPPFRDEWSITDEIRRSVVLRQWLIAIDSSAKPSDSTAAARCLIAMNAQTLRARKDNPAPVIDFANDNVLINAIPEERRERLASIAERLRARRLAGRADAGRSTAGPGFTPGAQMPDRKGGGEPA